MAPYAVVSAFPLSSAEAHFVSSEIGLASPPTMNAGRPIHERIIAMTLFLASIFLAVDFMEASCCFLLFLSSAVLHLIAADPLRASRCYKKLF